MIVNANPMVQTLHDTIRESKYGFYLTGSRYFGTAIEFSDTDYFVENSVEVKDFLLINGFRSISLSEYGDNNCVSVMRNEEEQIDIQLVKSVVLKNLVQKTLFSNGVNKPTKEMWNAMFALAGELR